jgi:hypothetical protein
MTDEQKATTMHQQAIFDAQAPQGRWAKQGAVHITATGKASPLVSPTWCQQQTLVPDEPPLGEDIDALPDMETVSGLPREPMPEREVQAQFNRRGL